MYVCRCTISEFYREWTWKCCSELRDVFASRLDRRDRRWADSTAHLATKRQSPSEASPLKCVQCQNGDATTTTNERRPPAVHRHA